MDVVRPEFLPDPGRSREEMEALQREIADSASFVDDLGFDPSDAALDATPDEQAALGAADAPVVVGVDQAFRDDESVSAAVAIRDGAIVERAAGRAPLDIPYIPGLLSFREGGAIVDALAALSVDPDLLVFDGSGRIHFRQAGLATHLGVVFDRPSVGVAKSLLCGRPRESVDGRPEGWRTPILADSDVDAPDGRVIGYAVQSRQYASSRKINPLYVSPGHRVSAGTAADLVVRCCDGYKLPE